MRATPLFRLARAAVFAAVCLGLGLVAHTVAGGTVSLPTAATGLALSSVAALPLTGRERGLPVILPVLGAVQAAMHVVFAAAHGIPQGQTFAHCVDPGFGMIVLHGTAVTLTAIWLARGEAACWALLRLLVTGLLRFLIAFLTPEAPKAPNFPAFRAVRQATPDRTPVTRRGPPSVVGNTLT
ncbi:MFS transporter [Nonomuraea sp. NPDC050536]|uniref:MFS transporter n=1 Tax=Nonomuraea sp. NPDC050536 TaxID=3364366 RepID=UPI0037C580BC